MDQVRLKPACSATETSYSIKSLNLASIYTGIILYPKQILSAFLLFAYGKNGVSHDVAHLLLD